MSDLLQTYDYLKKSLIIDILILTFSKIIYDIYKPNNKTDG